MKEYICCKSCGYIMEKSRLGDKCPACGVPSKMFEAYQIKISPRRKFILDAHLHPVVVHAPQAFALSLLLLSLFVLVAPNAWRDDILSTIKVLSIILPFAVAGSFATGLFDGKIRFHRITTPILVIKMICGAVFFAASCIAFAMIMARGMTHTVMYTVIAANFVAFICSAILGKLGAGLLNAQFPG